jgi:hypothetical protein
MYIINITEYSLANVELCMSTSENENMKMKTCQLVKNFTLLYGFAKRAQMVKKIKNEKNNITR